MDVSLSYNYQEFCKKKKSSTHCRGAASSSRGGKASETTVLPYARAAQNIISVMYITTTKKNKLGPKKIKNLTHTMEMSTRS